MSLLNLVQRRRGMFANEHIVCIACLITVYSCIDIFFKCKTESYRYCSIINYYCFVCLCMSWSPLVSQLGAPFCLQPVYTLFKTHKLLPLIALHEVKTCFLPSLLQRITIMMNLQPKEGNMWHITGFTHLHTIPWEQRSPRGGRRENNTILLLPLLICRYSRYCWHNLHCISTRY